MSDESEKFGPTGRFIELPARYTDPNFQKRRKKNRPDTNARPAQRRQAPAKPTCGCVDTRNPVTGAVVSVVKYCSRHKPRGFSASGRPKENA